MEVNQNISGNQGCENEQTAATGNSSSSEQSKNNTPVKTDFFSQLNRFKPKPIVINTVNPPVFETEVINHKSDAAKAQEQESKQADVEKVDLAPTSDEQNAQEESKVDDDVKMADQCTGQRNSKDDGSEDLRMVSNLTFDFQDKTGLYNDKGYPIRILTGNFILFQRSSLNSQNEDMDEAPSCAKVKGNKLQWNAMAYFVGSERVRKNRVDAIDHYQSILEAYESTRIVSYHCNKFSKEELKAFKTSVKRFRDKLEAKLKIAHTATGNRQFYEGAFLDVSYCQEVYGDKVQLSEKDFSKLLKKSRYQQKGDMIKSFLHNANAFISLGEVTMSKVDLWSLIELVDMMYQNQFDLYSKKSNITLVPHLVREKAKEYDDFMTKLSDVCDAMLPQGAETLEQLLRCIMAQLFESCEHRYEIAEFSSLWTQKNIARQNDSLFQAVVKLASLVVGIPFTNKFSRLAWFNGWNSALFTWNVYRSFSADTKIRRTLEIKQRLSFCQVDADIAKQIRKAFKDKLSSQADELQKQGYELLTTTFSKDNAAFAQAVTDFDSKTEEFFTNFTRPHLSKGRELNFFAVPQKVPQVNDSALDYILFNLQTTEGYRLRLDKQRTSQTSSCAIDILLDDLRKFANVWIGEDEDLISSLLSYSQILFNRHNQLHYNSFHLLMEDLVIKWQSMFLNNPTQFVACDVTMVNRLLMQKNLLNSEIDALQKCNCTDDRFQNARDVFIKQITCCRRITPYYLDVVLRRLLMRYFAEIWLHRDHLITLFKCPLSDQEGVMENLKLADFSDEQKPRSQAIYYQPRLDQSINGPRKTPQDYLARATELLKDINIDNFAYIQGVSILLYCLDPQNGPQNEQSLLRQILSLKDTEYSDIANGMRLEWFAVLVKDEHRALTNVGVSRLQKKCIKLYMNATKTKLEQLEELAETYWPLC